MESGNAERGTRKPGTGKARIFQTRMPIYIERFHLFLIKFKKVHFVAPLLSHLDIIFFPLLEFRKGRCENPERRNITEYGGITRKVSEYHGIYGILRIIAKIFEIQALESLESCLHMKSKRIYICCSLAGEL